MYRNEALEIESLIILPTFLFEANEIKPVCRYIILNEKLKK